MPPQPHLPPNPPPPPPPARPHSHGGGGGGADAPTGGSDAGREGRPRYPDAGRERRDDPRGGGGGGGGWRGDGPGRGGGFGGGGQGGFGGGFGGGGVPGRGGGGFGGGFGPGRGHGGGGRANPPPRLSAIDSVVTTNTFVAALTPHFGFYQIAVVIQDATGKEIDSRFARRFLFRKAVLDHHLRHLSPNERRDAYRSYFFVGSYFYAIRNFPAFRSGSVLYRGPEGSLTIGAIKHYTAPTPMATMNPMPFAASSRRRLGEVAVDANRCAHCTRTFASLGALLSHCATTGHAPVTSSRGGGGLKAPDDEEDDDVPSQPATVEVMVAYANCVLQASLNGDPRFKKWGREHVDLESKSEPIDRNRRALGIELYRAYSASFTAARVGSAGDSRSTSASSSAQLVLTVDLKAKIMRTRTLLQILCGEGRDPERTSFSRENQDRARREWEGKVIIHKHEKRCYTIHQLLFEHSARSLPIRDKSMSHEDYYKNVKGMELRHPTATPMVAVLGRREEVMYFPAEIVTCNDLDPAVREKLPQIASYPPKTRHDEIERFKRYVTPGSARGRGREDGTNLLPAAGIVLAEDRLVVPARVLSAPTLMAAGVRIASANPENWGNALSRANYNVNPQEQTEMHAVIFFHRSVTRSGAMTAFHAIRNRVNGFQTKFRLADEPYRMIETFPVQNDRSHHCEELERFLSAKSESRNLFFLQFVKPVHGNVDPDYSPVKYMLLRCGWLTQFVNFAKCDHASPREPKSPVVLQGVARQVLQKCGARLWWTTIPRSLPLPALFIGIDVSHAPKVFDPEHRGFLRKMSCAAIVTVVVRGGPSSDTVEMFSTTSAKYPGLEACLELDLQENVERTIRACNVVPACVVGWRDGLSDTAFEQLAAEEVRGIRAGLSGPYEAGSKRKTRDDVPVAYVICQKDVANKFLCPRDGHVHSAPSGTLVTSMGGWDKDHEGRLETFFINGRAPPFSTAKPVRFVVYERDEPLSEVPLHELTWNQCHEYPNWTGPVKQPGVTMMAHKLSMLAGTFADCGASIDQERLANRAYFL